MKCNCTTHLMCNEINVVNHQWFIIYLLQKTNRFSSESHAKNFFFLKWKWQCYFKAWQKLKKRIFLQIWKLNIHLFDVLRGLGIWFFTWCCCRVCNCVVGGCRDPFKGHETLFLFPLQYLENLSVLLITIQIRYIQTWSEFLWNLPTWLSHGSKKSVHSLS